MLCTLQQWTQAITLSPFQEVSEVQNLTTNILGIESTGGGIHRCCQALEAQYQALKDAPQKNRHVILFADAADAERDIDHKPIIQKMRADEITISVIALGRPKDSDAGLAEVARLGGGSIYFSVHPKELPKLFSMDTMIATQAGYVVEAISTKAITGLTALGGDSLKDFPTIEAYNIAYPKGQTQLGVQTTTDDASPILVHGQYGLGKSVAYLGDIGGPNGQNILQWSGFSSFVGVIIANISTDQRRIPLTQGVFKRKLT